MNVSRYLRRKWTNRIALSVTTLAMALGIGALLWILWTLFSRGLTALTPTVFTVSTPPPGSDGGLANAIVGSLLMVSAALAVVAPVGILAGICLAEFGRSSKFADAVRFINDVLLSAPSIVIGLFIYAAIVATTRSFSGWAGAAALAVIALPVIVRTTENMLALVPGGLREAAYALGAPKWKVITFVTLRAARNGVLTGVLLALARIAGETAPLLFTALNSQFFSTDMSEPMANLPVVIFQFAMSPYEDWQQLAWAGALLITLSVLLINIVARYALGKRG
ncbi:MAG: phosphate ABC transporter permease PstA [Burkholderiales bacterium]|nr:MAG: phosphate ABC transporter permease PstA [Burkholderiales bacterium]